MIRDGRALSPTFTHGAVDRSETAKRNRESARADDKCIEAWAAIFGAAGVVPAVRPRTLGLEDPAAGWRGRDGALTRSQMDGAGDTGPAREGHQEDEVTRVDVRVDGADLGEIEIAIDRMDSGVRVTIAARDDRAIRALEPERLRLLDVLTGSGVRVDSVTVVRSTPAGIPLAQGTNRPAADPREPPLEDTRRRPRKKNHFVG